MNSSVLRSGHQDWKKNATGPDWTGKDWTFGCSCTGLRNVMVMVTPNLNTETNWFQWVFWVWLYSPMNFLLNDSKDDVNWTEIWVKD